MLLGYLSVSALLLLYGACLISEKNSNYKKYLNLIQLACLHAEYTYTYGLHQRVCLGTALIWFDRSLTAAAAAAAPSSPFPLLQCAKPMIEQVDKSCTRKRRWRLRPAILTAKYFKSTRSSVQTRIKIVLINLRFLIQLK